MKNYQDLGFQHLGILKELLCAENARQLNKWGVQNHSLFEWLAYTMEELGELSEAISELEYRGGKKQQVINEALEVATLALKIVEMVKMGKLDKQMD